jgi:hypothetical protein
VLKFVRSVTTSLTLRAASIAGALTRITVSKGPAVLGASSVSFGAGMVYLPLAPIMAGVFMLWLDGQTP